LCVTISVTSCEKSSLEQLQLETITDINDRQAAEKKKILVVEIIKKGLEGDLRSQLELVHDFPPNSFSSTTPMAKRSYGEGPRRRRKLAIQK
jgi:hypothetical protein